MTVPEPPVPLENVCAVIYDDALYTYSPDAFLRLKLEPGAEWETLSKGEAVSGAVCVGTTPGDASQAALYIVGGTTENRDYRGLQKYTYSTKKWEHVVLNAPVTQNRQWHGATYIASSDTILVFAGTQDGVQALSDQTFTIHLPSRMALSRVSIAPPAISPLLMPWSDTDAVMVGGDLTNKRVMLFNDGTDWRDSGASLADPIPKDSSVVKGAIITGDDGSKSLLTFDMTQTPNIVNRILLLDGKGVPQAESPTVVARRDGGLRTRQSESNRPLTADDWPSYDGEFAPTSARTNYAAAQDPDGMIVFTGGNSEDALDMFDARGNTWLNASAAFVDQERLDSLSQSTTTSSITSATATSASTSTISPSSTAAGAAIPAKEDESALSSNSILGIVLGSIVGIMVILGLILWLFRRKRTRRPSPGENDGTSSIEKGDMGFEKELAVASNKGYFRGHQAQNSAGSYSSMAILMGRVNQQNNSSKGLDRKPSTGTMRSSMSSIFNKEFKSTISKPIPQPAQQYPPSMNKELGLGAEVGDRTTVFGPSLTHKSPPPRPPRGSATLIDSTERRSSGWNRYWSGGSALNILGFGGNKRRTMDSDQSSRYSDQKMNRITQDSATVPPLHIVEGRPELNRVVTGSPTVAHHPVRIPLKEGMSGKIERPVSQASSGYSSGVPDSVSDVWPPMQSTKAWGTDRAPSSVYGGSHHTQQSSFEPSSTAQRSGISRQPQLAMAKTSTDMSWLNLGGNSRG